ncbi:bifunctional adenosylcobinamide kinase/adenosylcobinamide-phosphate guanylyltransferase [Suipraeoptans intestinalis]|uniref:bifunctional adenosylcobinamide kinase/adenosylcobinamide-phosphate guanylyltransferase n=1 Tax=Suipraeoptans intestinalis TaxID=2606628 RepID=UPI0023F3DDB1|nr:bifunctional adenosylcobinamide kinase/adenosylcobinamide-phosphate guanylyltransferase [Suipraeoptans intestinalis]MDD7769345.1 bifunctional adenosylcobinamide kinase/adenosylcobinamide-phosphate guanylyltransferase [Suipraeoptans intestinalis]
MKLIIGGAAQGKRDYAREQFGRGRYLDGSCCSREELYREKGVYDFQLWIRKRMQEEKEPFQEGGKERLLEQCKAILQENPEIVIICNEVGCGLVPIEQADRQYRDLVGEICVWLAKEAEEVHRVICGIGRRIK